MNTLAQELGHLKSHVKYPASRSQVIAACNEMSDITDADKAWIIGNLPEGTYRGPTDVVNALLNKV
jgi:hypothetical protein